MRLTEQIETIISGLPEKATEFERMASLSRSISALPGATAARSEIDHFIDEFKICTGLKSSLERTVKNLERVRPLNLSIAPVVVSLIAADEDERYAVLILRYAAIPGERLHTTGISKPDVSSESFQRFLADIELLGANGLVHRYARGWPHVLVSSESKTLVMDDWNALSDENASDIPALIETVKQMIEGPGR